MGGGEGVESNSICWDEMQLGGFRRPLGKASVWGWAHRQPQLLAGVSNCQPGIASRGRYKLRGACFQGGLAGVADPAQLEGPGGLQRVHLGRRGSREDNGLTCLPSRLG